MYIMFNDTLLKVVGHYHLSVLSVSDGFPKQKLDRRVSGWGKLYPVFLDVWKF